MRKRFLASLAAGLWIVSGTASGQILLNEIYISHSGTDDQEFIEIVGPPGFQFQRHFVLVVEGDGAAAGTLDRAYDLATFSIPADGYFVLGGAAVPNVDFVVGNTNLLENGTETFYLVQDPSLTLAGLVGTDITTGPNTTQIPGVATIEDHIGVIDSGFFSGTDVLYDGAAFLGPDGPFLPAGVYRGDDGPNPWCGGSFLDFDDVSNSTQPRTPGQPNGPCVAETIVFEGFPHTSLGAAGLHDLGGRLVVSNIGSSGQDGVSIDIGDTNAGFQGAVALPVSLDPTSFCSITAIGRLGTSVGPISTIRATPVVGGTPEVQLDMDFTPLGATTATVELYDNGVRVFQQSGLTGGCRFPPPPSCVGSCGPRPWLDNLSIDVEFPTSIPVTIPGGPTLQADFIRTIPDTTGTIQTEILSMDLQGSTLPPVQILDEKVELFKGTLEALGGAELRAGHDSLVVSNIGSSGQDGVRYTTPPNDDEGTQVDLGPVDLSVVGSALIGAAQGSFNGVANSSLGTFGCQNNGGVVQAFADFSPLGATQVELQAYLNGRFQGTTTVPMGVLGDVGAGPLGPPRIVGCGKLPPDPPCFVVLVDPPGVISPSNGTPQLPFDCLRVLAEDAAGQVDHVESVDVRGIDLGPIRVEGAHDRTRFGGLQFTGQGHAELDHSPGGTLTVSNIGSSGCDGVSIDLGELGGAFGAQGTLPALMPPGTGCLATATGALPGGTQQVPLSTLRADALTGGRVQITPDFSPLGSSTHTVELLLQGQSVFTQSGNSGPGCIFPQPPSCVGTCGCPPTGPPMFASIDLPQPTPVTIPGGPTITADRLVLTPDNATMQPLYIGKLDLRTNYAGPPFDQFFDVFVEINCEQILEFENVHTILDGGEFSPGTDHLTISNIGSSGCDGVSIDIGDLDGFETTLEPVELAEPGWTFSVDGVGVVGGTGGSPLGSAGCTNNGGNVQAFSDFTPLGATRTRVEVWLGDSFVGSATVPTGGVVADVRAGPSGAPRIVRTGKVLPHPPCYFVGLDVPGTITPVGGSPLVGDEVRLLAADASATIDELTSFHLLGADLPSLTILGERGFDAPIGQIFCQSTPNSTGVNTGIEATGSQVALDDEVTLRAFNMPANATVFFIVSDSAGGFSPPFGGGVFCPGAPNIGRFYASPTGASIIGNSGPSGEYSISTVAGDWSTQALPHPSGVPYAALAGSTSYFAAWHRDIHPTMPGQPWAHLSDGLSILWQ